MDVSGASARTRCHGVVAVSAGLDLRGWAGDGDGLPSLEQLTRAYEKVKPFAGQLLPVSPACVGGHDLAALRQEVAWVTDARVLRRAVELLREA